MESEEDERENRHALLTSIANHAVDLPPTADGQESFKQLLHHVGTLVDTLDKDSSALDERAKTLAEQEITTKDSEKLVQDALDAKLAPILEGQKTTGESVASLMAKVELLSLESSLTEMGVNITASSTKVEQGLVANTATIADSGENVRTSIDSMADTIFDSYAEVSSKFCHVDELVERVGSLEKVAKSLGLSGETQKMRALVRDKGRQIEHKIMAQHALIMNLQRQVTDMPKPAGPDDVRKAGDAIVASMPKPAALDDIAKAVTEAVAGSATQLAMSDDLKQAIASTASTVTTMLGQMKSLDDDVKSSRDRMEKLVEDTLKKEAGTNVNLLKNLVKELEGVKSKLGPLPEMEALRAENGRLSSEVAEKDGRLKAQDERLKAQDERLKAQDERLKKQDERQDKSDTTVANLTQSFQVCVDQLNSKRRDYSVLKREAEKLQGLAEKQARYVRRLESEAEKLRADASRVAGLEVEVEAARADAEEQTRLVDKLRRDADGQTQLMRRVEQEAARFSEEASTQKVTISALHQQLRDAGRYGEEQIASLKGEVEDGELLLAEAQGKLDRRTRRLEEMTKAYALADQRANGLSESLDNVHGQLVDSQKALEDGRLARSELDRQVTQLQSDLANRRDVAALFRESNAKVKALLEVIEPSTLASILEKVEAVRTEQSKALTLDSILGAVGVPKKGAEESQPSTADAAPDTVSATDARLDALVEEQKGFKMLLHSINNAISPPGPKVASRKRAHTDSGDESRDDPPVDNSRDLAAVDDDAPSQGGTDWTRFLSQYTTQLHRRLQSINVVDDGIHAPFNETACEMLACVADDDDWARLKGFFNTALVDQTYCLGQLMDDPECIMPDVLTITQRKCTMHAGDPEKPCYRIL
ncbi:hypothetical protein LX32DRAFT_712451 [Colletotrichum zoysiae]|uniref:Uncharacterized protein n=1 Tax=Colletotrichum zoysiae TaxID=1216348 RepID=A0AAD9M4Q7_9PEZI|nr:hypothetical protein LX32DRAFT_712451 [Colletotrichum zoysiae]